MAVGYRLVNIPDFEEWWPVIDDPKVGKMDARWLVRHEGDSGKGG